MIVAGLYNREENVKILKNKDKLKRSCIFIDDDLAGEDRIRQGDRRKTGRIDRGNEHEVEGGYNKTQQIENGWCGTKTEEIKYNKKIPQIFATDTEGEWWKREGERKWWKREWGGNDEWTWKMNAQIMFWNVTA